MKTRMVATVVSALAVFALFSCSVVSQGVKKEAVPGLSFDELRRNTEQFVGETVVLGGYVLETRNFPEMSQVVVLQAPLGYRDRPESREKSQGRFMAVSKGFLDPEIFEKDTPITVAGKVTGKETVKIDEYSYPIVKVEPGEVYLWEEREYRTPYYYHDPFLYDPFYYDRFHPWGYPGYRFRPHPYWW
jgi:outer membrane lipoprotein